MAGNPNTDTASLTYTPPAAYSGPDSFTFTVSDGTVPSAPATISITVGPRRREHDHDLPGDRRCAGLFEPAHDQLRDDHLDAHPGGSRRLERPTYRSYVRFTISGLAGRSATSSCACG